jgi:hypothetical protein
MRSADYNLINPDRNAPLKPIGAKCLILRPNLWSGATGEVVAVYDNPKHPTYGRHRIKIAGKLGETFHADCWATELRLVGEETKVEDAEVDDFIKALSSL